MKLKIFFLLWCVIFDIQASRVIMIMGPSCAGKSTLSKYLCAQLSAQHEEWIVVDFDEVDENVERLITITNGFLEKNINVIIDTNTYENDIENKLNGAIAVTKIIVIAPLDILLQRDERRTQRLKRSEQKAFWCRHFVIESFNRSLALPSDLIIDSSVQSVQDSCDMILQIFNKSFIPNS